MPGAGVLVTLGRGAFMAGKPAGSQKLSVTNAWSALSCDTHWQPVLPIGAPAATSFTPSAPATWLGVSKVHGSLGACAAAARAIVASAAAPTISRPEYLDIR